MIIKKFNSFILNENFKTYKPIDVFKYLSKIGLKENDDYYVMYDNDKISLTIRSKYKKLYKDIIYKLENFYGWYLAYINDHNGIEDKNVSYYKKHIEEYIEDVEVDKDYSIGVLWFEPKYDIILDYSEIPDKIYHITNTKYYFKIKKKGLIPKHLDRISYHPDRIFFGLSKSECIKLSQHSDFELKNPIILTIDTKELKEKGIDFYLDSNFKDGGIYVINNISPKYIVGIEKIEDYD